MTYSKSIEQNLKVNFTYYTDSACTSKATVDMTANNVEGGTPIAGGIYYVIGQSEGNKNYNPVTSDCTLGVTINKVDATCPVITSYEEDYDGELHSFTVTKDAVGGTAKYCTENCEEEANWSTELPKRRNGGTTEVQIKVVADNSHNTVTCDVKTITIDRIKNDIKVNYYETPYTSERIEVHATAYEHEINPLVDVIYYSDSSCSTSTVPVDVGTYYVQITTPMTDDYQDTSTADFAETNCPKGLTITKVGTTTTLDPVTKVYDTTYQKVDTAQSVFNSNNKNIADSENVPKDTPEYIYNYYLDSDCSELIENENAPKDVRIFNGVVLPYYVKATLVGKSNYEASSSECVTYMMERAEDSIVIELQTRDYDDDNPSGTGVTAKPELSTHGYPVTYTYYTDSDCSPEYKTTTDIAVSLGGEPFAAGTYYVIGTTNGAVNNTNYNFVTTTCTKAVVINKVDSIITCEKETIGDETHNLIYNANPQVLAECQGGTFAIDASTNSRTISKTNAGDYELTCNGDSNHNTTQKTCTIDKADTITSIKGNNQNIIGSVTRDYIPGTRQPIDVDADRVSSILSNKQDEIIVNPEYNFNYYNSSDCSGSAIGSAPIDAGSYSVKASLIGTSDYNSSEACVPYTVNKIYSTIEIENQDNVAYTGNPVEARATSSSGTTVTFEYFVNATCSQKTTFEDDGATPDGSAPIEAGIYYVKATSAANNNYYKTTTDCLPAITIKAIYATCPTVTQYNGVYDKGPHTIEVGSTEGLGGTVYYKVSGNGEGTTNDEWVRDLPQRTNVGETIVEIKVKGDSTHLTQTCASKKIIITKKLDIIEMNPDLDDHVVTVTYDGEHHLATARSDSGITPTITYYRDASCNNGIAGTPINVGTYYGKAATPGNDNYDGNSICALAVVINKKDSTCPPNIASTDVPYDGQPHKITVSGNYEGGTLEFSKTGGTWSATNPEITNANESTQVSVQIHNTDGNYNDASCGTYNLIVQQIKPVITCSEPTYTGGQLNIASCAGGTIGGNLQTNAGDHIVTCSGDINHENIEASEGVKCNIKKSATTTSIPEQHKTYNTQPQEATGASSNLSSNNTNIAGATYKFKYYLDNQCKEVTTTPKYGGIYYVIATLDQTDNYDSSDSPCTKYTMDQDKPKVTITCNDITYNGNVQTIATCSTGGTIVQSTANRTNAGTYTVYCTGDDEHSNADPTQCTIKKAPSVCPALSSVTATYDEHLHYLAGNPVATGGTAEFKLSRCQYENHTNNNIPPDCSLVWTSTFMPDTAVKIQGRTDISIRVRGDENHNDNNTCPTLYIQLN